MPIRLLRVICFSVLALAGSVASVAQNNVYGIRDDLYRIYVNATDNVNRPECLEAADSMYRMARTMSDGKAMCLAQTIPVRYYIGCDKRDSVFKWADKLGETAKTTGYYQYYYFSESSRIIYHLNHKRFHTAISRINDMWHQAFERDSVSYGRFSAIQALGHLYAALYDRDLALKQYKEALGYMRGNVTDQDESGLAVRIGELYLAKGELDSAAVYCDIALKNTRTPRVQSIALMLRSRILFDRGDMDEFRRAYNHAFDRIYNRDILSDSTSIYLFLADKAMADGDIRVAGHYASRITGSVDRYDALSKVYEHFGEYEQALDAARRSRLAVDSLRREVVLEQMSILDKEIVDSRSRAAYMRVMDYSMSEAGCGSIWFWLFVSAAVLLVVFCVAAFLYCGRKRRRYERRLVEAGREIEEARLAVEMTERVRSSSYVQAVGRNMRNPLNAIVGFTQLLSDTDAYLPVELRKKYSGIVRANSNLLLALVDDMTDIAELEMQLREISLAEVSPNAVVRDAIAMFEARYSDTGGSNISLDFETEVTDEYVIFSDSVHLRQVLNLLLSNAEKFTNNLDGGNIRIGVSLSENLGKLTISVADTGIGIPPEQAEEIFSRFVKLNKAVPGNGLGLSLARMIIGHLDGEIFLDTTYTGGARFVILLPVGDF